MHGLGSQLRYCAEAYTKEEGTLDVSTGSSCFPTTGVAKGHSLDELQVTLATASASGPLRPSTADTGIPGVSTQLWGCEQRIYIGVSAFQPGLSRRKPRRLPHLHQGPVGIKPEEQ